MNNRRERGSRKRRSFGEDDSFGNFSDPFPQTSAPIRNIGSGTRSAEPVEAVVSWFNAEKGFGFVELSDGSGDAFLHIKTLEAAGLSDLISQTKLRVDVGQGQKGRQVNSILEVIELGERSAPANRSPVKQRTSVPGRRHETVDAIRLAGTVKWFNKDKGFGFVTAEDGGKDVFIHASVVEKSGLSSLDEGQSVTMQVVPGNKGREAVSIQIE